MKSLLVILGLLAVFAAYLVMMGNAPMNQPPPNEASESSATTSPTTPVPSALAGTSWKLATFVQDGKDVTIPVGEFNLTFDTTTVSGFGGCNTFNGPYSTGVESITMGPFATTLMACENSEFETDYLSELQNATSYRLTQDNTKLSFYSGVAGKNTLDYDRLP